MLSGDQVTMDSLESAPLSYYEPRKSMSDFADAFKNGFKAAFPSITMHKAPIPSRPAPRAPPPPPRAAPFAAHPPAQPQPREPPTRAPTLLVCRCLYALMLVRLRAELLGARLALRAAPAVEEAERRV